MLVESPLDGRKNANGPSAATDIQIQSCWGIEREVKVCVTMNPPLVSTSVNPRLM